MFRPLLGHNQVSPSVYKARTTQAVKTTSQLELRNVFVFAAKTDMRRIGTSGSRADCSAVPTTRICYITRYITRSARLAYTVLNSYTEWIHIRYSAP
jgi:hypothetical protein